jgi:hypothetical protein
VTRRLELGPLLVALGAVVLLVSLFLDWYEGGITAWDAFEVWDLVLAVLAIASLVAAMGPLTSDSELLSGSALPWLTGAIVLIVASQIINQPPAAAHAARASGSWIALGAAALELIGAVLTVSRVSFAVNVEGRDARRRVAAVDVRDPTTTESGPLFSRPVAPPEPAAPEPPPAAPPEPAAPEPPPAEPPADAAEPPTPADASADGDDLLGGGPGARVEETSSGPVRRTSASRRKS